MPAAQNETAGFTSTPPNLWPGVGLYSGLPEPIYRAAKDAVSQSTLKKVLRSPAHALYAMENPEQTPEMKFGTACHTMILDGPEAFTARYVISGQCQTLQKDGKSCANQGKYLIAEQWMCGKHGIEEDADTSREIISLDDVERMTKMRAAIMAHPAAKRLLDRAVAREVSAVWDDTTCELGAVRCKLRADMLCPDLGIIADLKTTNNASPEAAARTIGDFGYDIQAAHYLAGMEALDPGGFDAFAIIFVEKDPPCAVAVYTLEPETVMVGELKRRRALESWRQCVQSGVYPAYSEQAEIINLPDYELNRWIPQRRFKYSSN